MASQQPPTSRERRPPPPFRRVEVVRTEHLTPRMIRVTLAGPEMEGFSVEQPAASVRLLLPSADDLVIPDWNGNEFLLPGGVRPVIRTFTPRDHDPEARALDLRVVVHEGGAASTWARAAEVGRQAALSGPGRGYDIDRSAPGFVLAGDETALPAIGELLEALPATVPVWVLAEVGHPDARLPLPGNAAIRWLDRQAGSAPGDSLVPAIEAVDAGPDVRWWVAGEAAAVQRIRNHLFKERGVGRALATVRGYWKNAG